MRRSRSKKRQVEPLLVTALRRGGRLVRLEVAGHAGFAAAGKDIVCAAVSALVLTAAHGVAHYTRARASVSDDPHGDYILDVPGGGDARSQAVLETALAGLRAVSRSYPANLSVRERRTGAPRRRAEQKRPRKGA